MPRRLLIDWEDLRAHFASMPFFLPGQQQVFDDIQPLLSQQCTFEAGEIILKQVN